LDALRLVAISQREPVEASMNKQAVVSKFAHIKPGNMKYFKNVDVPLAVDKVPSSTPWR
jgi:hypothetical protein